MNRSRAFLLTAGALAAAIVVLSLAQPWVIRPLNEQGDAILGPPAFDAQAVAEKVWAEELNARVAAAIAISGADSSAKIVKGEGRVMSVDLESRVGAALIDLAPQDGRADVILQVGPVIPGGVLRDALGLRFADFDTQIEFANVGDALNKKAMTSLPALGDPKALEGKKVAFVGAGVRAGDQVRVVPVQLAVSP